VKKSNYVGLYTLHGRLLLNDLGGLKITLSVTPKENHYFKFCVETFASEFLGVNT